MKERLSCTMHKIFFAAVICITPIIVAESITKFNPEIIDSSIEIKRDLVIGGGIKNSGVTCYSGTGVQIKDVAGVTQTDVLAVNKSVYIAHNSGIAATLTLTLPSSINVMDGQTYKISSNNANLTLTIVPGAGTKVSQSITTLSNSAMEIFYNVPNKTWYRIS